MKSNKMYTWPNIKILLKLTGSIKKNLILIQYLINVCNKHERKIPCPYYVVCSFILRYTRAIQDITIIKIDGGTMTR